MKMSWITALTLLVLSAAAGPAQAAGDERAVLRAEDFAAVSDWLDTSTDKAACHSTTPCGTAYGACTLWSTTYVDCGDPFCGILKGCGEDCTNDQFCFGPATRQYRERYRVCLNELGQSCTEYQRVSTPLSCGC